MSSLSSEQTSSSGNQERARERIHSFFRQLTNGCGNDNCQNRHCLSSGPLFAHANLSNNQAALHAIQLAQNSKTTLCPPFSSTDASNEPKSGESMESHEQITASVNEDNAMDESIPPTVLGASASGDSQPVRSSTNRSTDRTRIRYQDMLRDAMHPPAQTQSTNEPETDRTSFLMDFIDDDFNQQGRITTMPHLEPRDRMDYEEEDFINEDWSSSRPVLDSEQLRDRVIREGIDQASFLRFGSNFPHSGGFLGRSSSSAFRFADRNEASSSSSSLRLGSSATTSASSSKSSDSQMKPKKPFYHAVKKEDYLTESRLESIITECEISSNWAPLIRLLGNVFGRVENITSSFLHESIYQKANEVREKADSELSEKESTNQSTASSPRRGVDENLMCPVDFESLRRSMKRLFSLQEKSFYDSLINAVTAICRHAQTDLKTRKLYDSQPDYLNLFVILYELPLVLDPSHFEALLPPLCKATACLPVSGQAELCRIWSRYKTDDSLIELQKILMQLITICCLTSEWDTDSKGPNAEEKVTNSCCLLKVIYYTSLLAGDKDPPELLQRESIANEQFEREYKEHVVNYSSRSSVGRTEKEPLALALEISTNDVRKPLISHEEFINETLNESIKIQIDYVCYKQRDCNTISFFNYPFLLTTQTKNSHLRFDNRMRMMTERREALISTLMANTPSMPYFKLRISRERLVEDALLGLEIATMENPTDLKKQLYIEFEGEQGIDEGGVSKEFFQLIIERIFNPDYGMFTFDADTNTFWFNPAPVEEMDREYTLIGIVLGLAIYNHVILDVRFPAPLYRKLLGKLANFQDLFESHPTLARGLQGLLDYEGDDIEETFGYNFEVSYQNVFGGSEKHALKPNGENMPINKENRQEFVNLYADFLLNSSIKRQFSAFRRGFQMVVDESPLYNLFRPDEIELLICGSKVYDFTELERVTEYEGDYDDNSSVIKNFWTVVHRMNDEQKRQLLQFTTGTDRVPLGGMKNLKFIIVRQGPDTDRLPSAHTCFNVLLLPEYSTLEKLERLLLIAITYSKGFGML